MVLSRKMEAVRGPSKAGGKGGAVKNLMKKTKKDDEEEEEIEDLEQLMEQDKPRRKTPSIYGKLSMGKFLTKGTDRKARLDQRHERIKEAAQKGKDDNDDDDDNDDVKDEIEKEKLEHETRQFESQLKKAERAESLACDREEKKKATEFSKWIQGGKC